MKTVEKRNAPYARLGTIATPESLLREFLFALKALIYFAIFTELVFLAYLIKALV